MLCRGGGQESEDWVGCRGPQQATGYVFGSICAHLGVHAASKSFFHSLERSQLGRSHSVEGRILLPKVASLADVEEGSCRVVGDAWAWEQTWDGRRISRMWFSARMASVFSAILIAADMNGVLFCWYPQRAFAIEFCTSSLRTEMESKHCLVNSLFISFPFLSLSPPPSLLPSFFPLNVITSQPKFVPSSPDQPPPPTKHAYRLYMVTWFFLLPSPPTLAYADGARHPPRLLHNRRKSLGPMPTAPCSTPVPPTGKLLAGDLPGHFGGCQGGRSGFCEC